MYNLHAKKLVKRRAYMLNITAEEHADLVFAGAPPRGTTLGELVPLAAKQARVMTMRELEDPNSLANLYTARMRIKEALGRTFPVEEDVRGKAVRMLLSTEKEISRYELTPLLDLLPTIDLSFLAWKKPNGYPGFSVYSLDNPECTISFKNGEAGRRDAVRLTMNEGVVSIVKPVGVADVHEGSLVLSPNLPSAVKHYYLDPNLRRLFKQQCRDEGLESITLTSRYTGVMPDWVRERIHGFLNRGPNEIRFDCMFIVAEAPAWSKSTVKAIPVGDPLVIGLKDRNAFLVAAYDLTPVEKLAESLCSKPEGHSGHVHN